MGGGGVRIYLHILYVNRMFWSYEHRFLLLKIFYHLYLLHYNLHDQESGIRVLQYK